MFEALKRVRLYRTSEIMAKNWNLTLRAMGKKPAGLRVVTKRHKGRILGWMSLRLGTWATGLMVVSYTEVLLCIYQVCGVLHYSVSITTDKCGNI